MSALLCVENLSKHFTMHILNDKHIEALRKVSFVLEEGEIIGLTGRSGSGKSTLMKCIYRTYLAAEGALWYQSQSQGLINLVDADEHLILHLRKTEITYCSQFLSVIPRIPAVEIVADALVRKNTTDRESARQSAMDLLARLNLPRDLWDAYPSTFSGGEQQRINIARAIIARPRLLLVDEPTASLDPRTKDAVIDMILEMKQLGTSVLCITHDSYTLQRLSDKVYRLESGDFAPSIEQALPGYEHA
jgi:alpha-D-ribose 1-methylphosphonate 5-triphosphate synthase subunit PhnL